MDCDMVSSRKTMCKVWLADKILPKHCMAVIPCFCLLCVLFAFAGKEQLHFLLQMTYLDCESVHWVLIVPSKHSAACVTRNAMWKSFPVASFHARTTGVVANQLCCGSFGFARRHKWCCECCPQSLDMRLAYHGTHASRSEYERTAFINGPKRLKH